MAAEEEQRQQRKAAAKRRFRLAGRKVQVQNILGTLGGGLSVKEAAQRLAAGNAFNARRGAGGLSPRTLAWNKLAPDANRRRLMTGSARLEACVVEMRRRVLAGEPSEGRGGWCRTKHMGGRRRPLRWGSWWRTRRRSRR